MFPMGLVIQPCKPSKKMHIKLINPLPQEYKTKYPKQSKQSKRKIIRVNKTKKKK
jgi:hypothetical protein